MLLQYQRMMPTVMNFKSYGVLFHLNYVVAEKVSSLHGMLYHWWCNR